jgi:hypothetical protein
MSFALPSKKIQALIIIVLALFIAYFLSTSNVGSWFGSVFSKKTPQQAALASARLGSVPNDLDTDRDGLRDWEELLWAVDENNADTDSDGTNDGDEIKAGRDPKIAGPDDSLEKTRGISAASISSFSSNVASDADNISVAVSKDLFAKFMALQSSGGELTEENQAQLVASVISEIDPGSIPPRYTIQDVHVTETNSASLRSYGNEVARIIVNLQGQSQKNISNESALALFDSSIASLQKLTVPSSLGIVHLQLLNNYNASYQMLILLGEYEADPVKGLIALKSYKENMLDSGELLGKVATELKNNAIIFDKSESGYIWNTH